MPLGPFPGLPVLKSIVYYKPGKKVRGTVDKMPTCDALLWSGKSLFNFPSPPPPQSNVGIVGLLWMIHHQHCVEGWEGEVDRETICWQKCNVPRVLIRIVTIAALTIPSWVAWVYTSYLYISGSRDSRWCMSTSVPCLLRSLQRKKLANGNSTNMFSYKAWKERTNETCHKKTLHKFNQLQS